MPFVHLHVHSHYSMLAGASSPAELVGLAAAQGQPQLALTELNGMWGAVPFQRACEEQGVAPIHGAELDAEPPIEEAGCPPRLVAGALRGERERVVLLARNAAGFAAISRLCTLRQLNARFELADEVGRALVEHAGDVFALCDHPGLLRRWARHAALRQAAPGEPPCLHVLLPWQECIHEPQRLAGPKPPLAALEAWLAAPTVPNRRALQRLEGLARELGLPTVASGDVWFARREQLLRQRVLSAIRRTTTLGRLEPRHAAPEGAWLRPPAELAARLDAEYPGAAARSVELARRCAYRMPLGGHEFPDFPLPPGESHESLLWKVAFDGLSRRFRPIPPRAMDRLQQEMRVVEELGFAEYLLVVWDIARYAHEEGIPVVGRGSAANSLLCFVLGITNVDPLEHDLFFQRFLNPERVSPPDIDLDFCWRRRDQVLRYVYERYGEDRVALLGTINTLAPRSAVREVARAVGLPDDEITRVTRRLPHRGLADIARWKELDPRAKGLPDGEEPWRSILEVGAQLEGFPRHMGIHAGGIVISRTPLTDRFPLQWARKGFVITQPDMYAMEDIGLVKIDLLATRGLSVVADTVASVEANTGRRVDLQQRYDDDAATRRAMRRGETMGCFYVESPAMRNLLQKLQADSFPLVVAASSLIRPGPSDSGMMRRYVDCHLGLADAQRLHPDLAFLDETYGVMVYQEDVMRVGHLVGGLSLGEADLMRRAMSFKGNTQMFLDLRAKFLDGATARGTPHEQAEEIWRQMESFAGYAFCKAHSAAYAVVSFQAVYLKAHWPAEFMAAVLSNQGGYYSAAGYLEEARRLGLRIRLPDVNRSDIRYRGEGDELRIGLLQVQGLGERTMEALVREREDRGFFVSLGDLVARVPEAAEDELQALIRVGAMDSFELSRPELLWKLQLLKRRRQRSRTRATGRAAAAAPGLFPDLSPAPAVGSSIVPRIPDWDAVARLRAEQEGLHLSASHHPMAFLRRWLQRQRVVCCEDVAGHAGRRVRVAGTLLTRKPTSVKKTGEPMVFLTLEDETGLVEVVLFPGPYARHGHRLLGAGPWLVEGRVQEEHGAITVEGERVELLH